jgi:cephalosporin-C deacetylase-like acetyl esterase
MIEQFVSDRAHAFLRARAERLASLSGAPALAAEQRAVTQRVRELLGPFPPAGPLTVNPVATAQRDEYTLQTLTFAGLPGTVIPANLYLPHGRSEPFPAVVVLSGDAPEGKMQADRQRLGQFLARRGIAALLFDGIGCGERVEFYDATLRRSWLGRTAQVERANLAYPMWLTGQNLSAWEAFEAQRAFDVLCAREDVDARRLGLIADGSAEALLRILCCLEPRLSAAAAVSDACDPAGGGHIEDTLPGLLPAGLNWDDLFLPFAPKPLLLICGTPHQAPERHGTSSILHKDALDRGGLGALRALRSAYDIAHAARNLVLDHESGPANLAKWTRLKIADHFARAFGSGEERLKELDVPQEPDDTLRCTETGQVGNSLNARTLFACQQETAAVTPPETPLPADAAGATAFRASMRARILDALHLPETHGAVEREVESRANDWGLNVEKGRLIIADGLYVPYRFFTRPRGQDESESGAAPVLLALHERGIAGVSSAAAWMESIPQAGFHIMAIDVAGVGETRLQAERDEHEGYEAALCGDESLWARRALNAGSNLFGLAVFSVLRTAEHLRTRWEVGANPIAVSGTGRGALWALYAAALDEKIASAALLRGLGRYKSLVERCRNNHHFSIYLPGCLKSFDLPHVAACVAPRPLTIINAIDQRKERKRLDVARNAYAFAAHVYGTLGAAEKFSVATSDSAPETLARVLKVIAPAP